MNYYNFLENQEEKTKFSITYKYNQQGMPLLSAYTNKHEETPLTYRITTYRLSFLLDNFQFSTDWMNDNEKDRNHGKCYFIEVNGRGVLASLDIGIAVGPFLHIDD